MSMERIQDYINTMEKKVGPKFLAQLRKRGWKLTKNTFKRYKNKAPETHIFEGKIDHKMTVLKTVLNFSTSLLWNILPNQKKIGERYNSSKNAIE